MRKRRRTYYEGEGLRRGRHNREDGEREGEQDHLRGTVTGRGTGLVADPPHPYNLGSGVIEVWNLFDRRYNVTAKIIRGGG